MPGKKKRAVVTTDNRGAQDLDMEVGRRVRLSRIEQNISQAELGEALGITFQQIQKYEKGTNRISSSRLVQIALTLKTTPHDLMGWNDDGSTALIDVETYKLAKAFSGLKAEWKRPIRSLIGSLMERDHAK